MIAKRNITLEEAERLFPGSTVLWDVQTLMRAHVDELLAPTIQRWHLCGPKAFKHDASYSTITVGYFGVETEERFFSKKIDRPYGWAGFRVSPGAEVYNEAAMWIPGEGRWMTWDVLRMLIDNGARSLNQVTEWRT